jgi:hypothetical protein
MLEQQAEDVSAGTCCRASRYIVDEIIHGAADFWRAAIQSRSGAVNG